MAFVTFRCWPARAYPGVQGISGSGRVNREISSIVKLPKYPYRSNSRKIFVLTPNSLPLRPCIRNDKYYEATPRERILCHITMRSTKVNVFILKGIFVKSRFKIIKIVTIGDGSLHDKMGSLQVHNPEPNDLFFHMF